MVFGYFEGTSKKWTLGMNIWGYHLDTHNTHTDEYEKIIVHKIGPGQRLLQ